MTKHSVKPSDYIMESKDKPCPVCGGVHFYKTSRTCIKCMRDKARETNIRRRQEKAAFPAYKKIPGTFTLDQIAFGAAAFKKAEAKMMKGVWYGV